MSEAPISMPPLSMRSFEGGGSAPPPSMGPSSINFARFAGEAGPGYRVHEGEGSLRAKLEGSQVSVLRVVRVSPVALWLAADGHTLDELRAAYAIRLLAMGRELGPFPAFILSVDNVSGAEIVGVKLGSIPVDAGRELMELIHDLVRAGLAEPARSLCVAKEFIGDKDRIRNLMGALQSTGGLGILRAVDGAARIESIVNENGEDVIHWKAPEHWGEPPYVIDMAGYNSIHELTFASNRVEDGRVVTSMPVSIERLRYRWYRRCVVRSHITVSFRHPLWNDLEVSERKVRDISAGGICFETDLSEDLAFPGLEIPELRVHIEEEEEPILMQGQVRVVSLGKDGETPLCGMMLSPRSAEDERRWNALIGREMHATTQSGVEWSESIWSLFESSGYFNLSGKSPDQFNPLKASFLAFGQRAVAIPQLLCQAVWPSQRGVEASLSLLKSYRGSWLCHQLAKRSGRPPEAVDPRQILRDIYVRALEHPQGDPQFRWVIAHVEGRVPWSLRAHIDFAKKHEGTGLTLAMSFQLMEISSTIKNPVKHDIEVGPATYEETEQFLHAIRQCRAEPYIESLDLTEDNFDLWEVRQLWQAAGFARERALLIARHEGRAIAGAFVESGETGTTLFRLLDGVRIIPLEPGGDALAFRALIDASRQWYQERKKESFMFFRENRGYDVAHGEMRDLGEGYFWALSAMLLPEFLEHIYELTAPRRR